MYVCEYVCVNVCMSVHTCAHVCSCVCMSVCVYVCVAQFPALTAIKTKYQLTLKSVEEALCPVISNIWLMLNSLCKDKYEHPSH